MNAVFKDGMSITFILQETNWRLMSPRGVTIPEVREQLFAAAERVLAREGPGGLSGRAITREAGVATGLLHSHFADLDAFLTELILDRSRGAAAGVARLRSRAGEGSVTGNLTEAALAVGAKVPIFAGLVRSRPALAGRLGAAHGPGASVLTAIEAEFAAYLEAEKRLGRIAADADTPTLALAVIGTVHHLLSTGQAEEPDLRDQVGRIITTLLAGVTATPSAPQNPAPP
jgi:AcrR family transcriptional regulator